MSHRQLAMLICLAALTACHRKEKFSTPIWFFSYSSPSPSKWDTILVGSSYIDLEPDSSYTRNFDRFEFGNWSRVGDLLYLTDQHHVTYEYHIADTGKNKLSLLIAANKMVFFQGQARPPADSLRNPFSLYNNRWRIPATRPESLAEIRERMLNHLHFWETFFKWGDDNNVGALDARDIPSALRMHGNGFGVVRYAYLSPQWKSLFYSESDCRAADSLIRDVFNRTEIKWPDAGDASASGKNLISGVQQLEAALRPK